MLVIIIIIFIAFNAIFINSGNLTHELVTTVKDVQGRVLGVNEEISTLPLAQPIKQKPVIPQKIDQASNLEILADSSIAIDYKSRAVLFNQQADKQMPIASITKLMTALVFLDYNPGWEVVYQIRPEDIKNEGKVYLLPSDQVKVKNLFYLSLVGSANSATMALVHATGLTTEEFINQMNQKAQDLGLTFTTFDDPTGLSNNNVSTAVEIAKFTQVALADEVISQASLTKKYEFNTLSGRQIVAQNTDDLLDIFLQNGIKILGGKTGYIKTSGYCLVSKFINQAGHEIITVVLGAVSDSARFSQTKELAEWIYQNYKWQ